MKVTSVMAAFEVDSVAALRTISKIKNKVARTAGGTSPGDGNAGKYWFDPSDTTSADNGFTVIVADDGGRWKLISRSVSTDITVRIPTDFPDMQTAVNHIHHRISMAQGKILDLKFDSGHQITGGLLTQNGDYGYIRISAVDPITYLSPSFVGVTIDSLHPNSLIVGRNARMPTLACLIRADDKCDAGYYVYSGATGYVLRNCGVTYAGSLGLYVAGGTAWTSGANFSYANRGNRVTANGRLACEGTDFSYARGIGWDIDDVFGLDVSRGSIVYAMSQSGNIMKVNNSSGRGLSARRSWVAATAAIADNCVLDGFRADIGANVVCSASSAQNCGQNGYAALNGGTMTAAEANANGCTGSGFYANSGGTIAASESTANNCGINGYFADKLSTIEASLGEANGCTTGVTAGNASTVNFSSGQANNCTSRAVFANAGSTINAISSVITGSTVEDVRCTRGSTIQLHLATTTNSVGHAPDISDVNVAAFNAVTTNGIVYA